MLIYFNYTAYFIKNYASKKFQNIYIYQDPNLKSGTGLFEKT
jgi:hypothetical protein